HAGDHRATLPCAAVSRGLRGQVVRLLVDLEAPADDAGGAVVDGDSADGDREGSGAIGADLEVAEIAAVVVLRHRAAVGLVGRIEVSARGARVGRGAIALLVEVHAVIPGRGAGHVDDDGHFVV